MSDGQTFLLLFLGFYLVECCTLVTPGSQVFVRGFGRHYRRRHCLLEFGGLRKQLFFLYFLPWPGRAHVFPPPGPKTRALRAHPPGYGRYLRLLNAAGDPLATQGMMMWLIFFVFIPILYFVDPSGMRVLLFAGLGYLFLFWQTGCFFCVHRRFFRKRDEDRLKHTLTMALLPWHGMKAVDHLVMHPKLDLQPVHLDALLLSPAGFRESAALAWRRACHHPAAKAGERRRLEAFLAARGIETADFDKDQPTLQEGEQYCPVCHATYGPQAERCQDCGGVALLLA